MSPLVSVVIPTWNRAEMVREAVDSVLSQNYQEFEIIVVDDGSDDGTRAQLERYGAAVRVISQSRAGPAAARNTGVHSSRGKYLAFLDSDDLWLPEKLEAQVEFLESSPQFRICQTEEIWVRRGVRVNPKKRHRKPSGDVFRASLALCLVSPSAAMMTRNLFDEMGGFDERLPVCEDYDLWLRIAARHQIALIDRFLVVKRGGHENQLSRSTWGMDRFRVFALEKLLASGIDGEKREWVVETLRLKVGVLSAGARKRGKEAEAAEYEEALTRAAQAGI
ncbi:MAG: glycosyltransferase family 2 protein [Candidatus Binatia bacterium]